LRKPFNSILLFFILTILFQIAISLWLSQMQNPLSAVLVQVTFKKEEFLNLIAEWNNIDRTLFLMHYLVDFIYPFVYGRLLYLLIVDASSRAQSAQQSNAISEMIYIPALAAMSDLLENSIHLLMVGAHIQITAWSVAAAAFFSMVKWTGLFGCVLVLILTYLRQWFKKTA
jgi:hypothetical protein